MTGTPMGGRPTVDVVIVSYNTRELLDECLTALRGDRSISRVRVADNGSEDGSLEMVRAHHPGVDLVSFPDNPGYGAAANALVARSTADVVVLLNADVRPAPGAVDALATHLRDHPAAAIAGPRIESPDGSLQRSCHDDPDVYELLLEESGLHHVRRRWSRRGLAAFDHDEVRSVPWVLGAVLAIRRSAFDTVGGFDPGFFLYYEEVDLCRRLRLDGWEVHFVPAARVVHHGGASTGRCAVLAERHRYRSLVRFHEIHGTAHRGVLRLAFGSVIAARAARDSIASVAARRPDERQRRRSSAAGWRTVLGDVVGDHRGPPAVDERNASRGSDRLDWLVLLPDVGPDPTVVVLGDLADRTRSEIGRHFGVDRVWASLPATRSVDLVIAGSTATRSIEAIVDALAPGGCAFVIRDRGRRGQRLESSRRLARAATQRGATTIGRYWVLPDTTQPHRFVPLDDRAVLRWYLTNLLVPSTMVQRFGRAALVAMPRLASGIATCHAVVVRRGERRAPSLLESRPVVDAGARSDDAVLVMTSGYDAGSRTVALPFHRRSPLPHMTVKVATLPELHEPTEREHRTLRSLQQELPAELQRSVPAPLAIGEWGSHLVSAERFLHGPSLAVELRTNQDLDARIERLDEVAAWVTALHRHTACDTRWSEHLVARWLGDTFDRYCERFDPPPVVRSAFDRATGVAGELIGTALPLVRRHVDVAPWNVIVTDRGIAVVDWETGGDRSPDGRGLPVCDLEYFVKYWLHIVAESAPGAPPDTELFAALPQVRGIDRRATAAAHRTLTRYCEELRIDPRSIPPLTLYNWAEHAVFRADRCDRMRRSDGDGGARRYVDALARHPELFAGGPVGCFTA